MAISVPTGRVVAQFVVGVVDGPDTDDEPDLVPASGVVVFEASVPYLPHPGVNPNPVTVLKTTITGVLDSDGYLCTPDPRDSTLAGKRGIRLFATESEASSVNNWTWKASPQFITSQGKRYDAVPAFNFALLPGSEVDLTTVVRVPSSPGIGVEQALAMLAEANESAKSALTLSNQALAVASNAQNSIDNLTLEGAVGPPGPAGTQVLVYDSFEDAPALPPGTIVLSKSGV